MSIQLNPKEQEVADDVLRVLEDFPQLKAAKTPFQKRMTVRPVLKQLRSKIEEDEKRVAYLNEKTALCSRLLVVADEYNAWKEVPPHLEQNDCSRLHQLIAYLKLQHKFMAEIMKGDNPHEFRWEEVKSFVVEHNWAAAFANATDYNDGSFNLPYELCAFEFRISGRNVIVMAAQTSEEVEPAYTFYVGFKDCWLSEGPDEQPQWSPPLLFAISQIKAICVALDAEVATHNVMRASDGVNKKRISEGREPFYSYHVVNLSRRSRVANPVSGGGGHGKRRLHFRRGHWRHFEKFKTWVRWCLVGDPDLGFVDKEYRL